MKNPKSRKALVALMTVAWIGVIWGNSLLPGSDSSQVSGWAAKLLQQLFPFLDMQAEGATLILRKCAHFSEFALLGVLLGSLARLWEKRAVLPVLWGIAVACTDETIQRFVPGRYGCVTDVLIDSAGVAAGVLVLLLFWKIKKTRCR